MIGALRAGTRLSFRHARHAWVQTVILSACVGATLLPPLAARVVVREYEDALRARAGSTPLIAGARGSRFDLTMAMLHFRRAGLEPLPMREYRAMQQSGLATVVPVNTRFTAAGTAIVATSPEYLERRGLRAEQGSLPTRMGEAVVGARAARELGVGPGGTLFSDPTDLYDLSRPASLKLRITGVLAPTGGPDDHAVFTDLKTAWVLEGAAHGHAEPLKIDPSLIAGESERSTARAHVRISEALIDYNEVTPENAATYHLHADEDALPLTGVLVFPNDAKSGTILKARINSGGEKSIGRMFEPGEVVEEVLGAVLRVRRLVDALAVVLGCATAVLMGLVVFLSAKLRGREMETLRRIGCPPGTVFAMHAVEIGLVVAVGTGAALGLAAAAAPLWPMLSRLVQGS